MQNEECRMMNGGWERETCYNPPAEMCGGKRVSSKENPGAEKYVPICPCGGAVNGHTMANSNVLQVNPENPSTGTRGNAVRIGTSCPCLAWRGRSRALPLRLRF